MRQPNAFLHCFRSSTGAIPDVLRADEDRDFRMRMQSSGLSTLLGYDTTGLIVTLSNCSSSLFPALSDDKAVPMLQAKLKHTQFQTNKLNKLIESMPGLICLIIRGLDGFGTDIDRIRRWLRMLRRVVYFYFLINDEEAIPSDGIGLIQAQSSVGFRLVCLSSQE
jgi:hypothetical protein